MGSSFFDGRALAVHLKPAPFANTTVEAASDRARLIQTIKCGRPGTGMPAFDEFAYSDGRCYGMKKADVKSPMPDPAATFQPREIDLLADFLFAKVIGKVRAALRSTAEDGPFRRGGAPRRRKE